MKNDLINIINIASEAVEKSQKDTKENTENIKANSIDLAILLYNKIDKEFNFPTQIDFLITVVLIPLLINLLLQFNNSNDKSKGYKNND